MWINTVIQKKIKNLNSRTGKTLLVSFTFFSILLLLVFFTISGENVSIFNDIEDQRDEGKDISIVKPLMSYTPHVPIHINENSDFITQGWPGDGSLGNPYLISGYSFFDHDRNENLIDIRNTDVYFEITNCVFNGGVYGIYFYNVSNGKIKLNIISNNTHNIYFSNSNNNSIHGNYINNSLYHGLNLDGSSENHIRNNSLFYNGDSGVYIYYGQSNRVDNNTIYENGEYGIHMYATSFNWIYNNTIQDNVNEGIAVWSTSSSTIIYNDFLGNNGGGVQAYDSDWRNSYLFNFWDDYTGVDSDGDGIGDSAYDISGVVHAKDYWPLISSRTTQPLPYQLHSAISIDGNADFLSQAITEGWPGAGTENDPIILSNLLIYTLTSGSSLKIINTDLYFNVEGCLIAGGGLSLEYLQHGNISSSFIYNGGPNLKLDHAANCTIMNNTIFLCSGSGIHLRYSDDNTLLNNDVSLSLYEDGLLLSYSNNATIYENKVYNNGRYGLQLFYSSKNRITNNSLSYNVKSGVYIYYGQSNRFVNNTIYENVEYGIHMYLTSFNWIYNNTIRDNVYEGIAVWSTSSSIIIYNDFLGNNAGGVQAYDTDWRNNYLFNYWDDYLGIDSDGDGIGDSAYDISGAAHAKDYWPLISSRTTQPLPYQLHSAISIDGNPDFSAQAITEGWSGAGTENDPIILSNLLIYTLTPSSSLKIINTDLYFNVERCLIAGGGLSLESLQHGNISSTIIYNGGPNLKLDHAANCTIMDNTIFLCSGSGIHLSYSDDNTLLNNDVSLSLYEDGILLSYSSNATIYGNKVYNNGRYGLQLFYSSENRITNNSLYYNVKSGVYIYYGQSSRIVNNTIYENVEYGIHMYLTSFNWIYNNTIQDNVYEGIAVWSTYSSIIIYNDFLGNNGGGVQAYDTGWTNNYLFNYWDDYSGIDSDGDGIGDSAYDISGALHAKDYWPLISSRTTQPLPYQLHSAISIDGNADFLAQAITEGWSGAGTENDPIILSNLLIYTLTSGSSLKIRNTDLYFNVDGCLIAGGGLSLEYLQHGNISSSFIYNGGPNIKLDHAANCTIMNNTIFLCGGSGIYLSYSDNNALLNNDVSLAVAEDGISLSYSSNVTIYGNKVYNNGRHGLQLYYSSENRITNNSLSDNTKSGVYIFYGQSNRIINNTIYENVEYGIHMYLTSFNLIYNNTIRDNVNEGIELWSVSSSIIIYNDFLGNNGGAVQAYDTAWSNNYLFNYWDDYLGIDSDGDGIGDSAYDISGVVHAKDYWPLVSSRITQPLPYQLHSAISIDGNADFLAQAITEGWSGAGTENDPIILSNLLIYTLTSGSSLKIRNTNLYFNVEGCLIAGGGLSLEYLQHGNISSTIIYNGGPNLNLDHAANCTIMDNTIFLCSGSNIYLSYSDDNALKNNDVSFSVWADGIHLYYSSNITIYGNKVYNNSQYGIQITYGSKNRIINNSLSYNVKSGVYIYYGQSNRFINNIIYDNGEFGIYLSLTSFNLIYNNTIQDNVNEGILVWSTSSSTIIYNDFLGNNGGGVQAYDTDWSNNYLFNYWDDYSGIDSDGDGIGDSAYDISGAVHAKDYWPLISSRNTQPLPYQHHSAISIDGNADFLAQAITEGWSGAGTENDPIILSNLLIYTLTSGSSLKIRNTDLYFNVEGCLIAGGGISLEYLQHGNISSTIIYNGGPNLNLDNAANCTIMDNTIFLCGGSNIYLSYSDDNALKNNDVSFSVWADGIHLYYSSNAMIYGNKVYNNSRYGIQITYGSKNRIINNSLFYNMDYGCYISYSAENLIFWNIFVENKVGSSFQAYSNWDNFWTNRTHGNYWSDYGGVDADANGIGDTPYDIFGTLQDDDKPLMTIPTEPLIHRVSKPTISYPNGDETITGMIMIQWATSYDSFRYDVSYEVYYSSDNGLNWIQIITGLTETSYDWDTTTLSDGENYLIKIIANSSKGPSAEDISDGVFTIWNEMDPPGPFDLSTNADSPDTDGNFDLIWTISEGADNYSVYVYESYITQINDSLTLLEYQTAVSPYTITGLPDDVYYYIVLAYNGTGYTLSNCIAITVELPPEEPPGEFTLSTNAGSPDTDGSFNLFWTISEGADNYSIYNYDGYIIEINGSLTLLEYQTANSPFSINGLSDGTHYYIAVAYNANGYTLSNCIAITVELPPEEPPGEFALSTNAGSPDTDGSFNLFWTISEGADNYSIYNYDGYIIEINGSLTLIEYQTANSPSSINGLSDGTYYYIAVAYNANGYTLSNCIAITVEIPPEEPITPPNIVPGYDISLIIAIFGICSILVYYYKRRNMNK